MDWLFGVFLGFLLGLLFIKDLVNMFRKNKPDNTPTKSEQEIEAYEETLKNKLDKNSARQEEKQNKY